MDVIAENWALNRAIARQMGCQFTGFVSHPFNLAVKHIISEHCLLIDENRTIMHKRYFQVCRAQLRKLTDLALLNAKRIAGLHLRRCLSATSKLRDIYPVWKSLKWRNSCRRTARTRTSAHSWKNEGARYHDCGASDRDGAALQTSVFYWCCHWPISRI